MRPVRALLGGGVLLAVALAGCSDPDVISDPEPVEAIADGEWFALVVVGEDETQEMTLGVDLAQMLSGEEAREAAIEDGIIEAGEDLPNDFYIHNPEIVYEMLHLDSDAQIELISSNDTSVMLEVTPEELQQLYIGAHPSQDGFYLASLTPIPMTAAVNDGMIESISQVYVP